MSLLLATFSIQANSDQWNLHSSIPQTLDTTSQKIDVYFKDHNYTKSPFGYWCSSAKFVVVDKQDGNSTHSGNMTKTSQCLAKWTTTEGVNKQKDIRPNTKTVTCPVGQRPTSYNDTACIDFEEFQCPANEVVDSYTGNCVCADGNELDQTNSCQPINNDDDIGGGDGDGGTGGDGSGGDGTGGDGTGGGNGNYDCNSSESCLVEAQGICSADNRTVMEYQYQGAGYYHYRCGYEDYNCGQGFTWDRPNQVCKPDQDNDGIADEFDPQPEDPNETGDRDGDGVPDRQDSHPDDPDQWNGNPTNNHNGQNVNPIGPSEQFDDSAIVAALNENTQTSNTTNAKLDDLTDQGSITNDLLGGIGESLDGISDALGQEEPTGKGAGDLDSGINSALDEFENKAIDEFNKDLDSGLFVQREQLPTIETAFGGLELEKCEDVSTFLFTLELCSLAPRINPILYWAFACFTVIACFHTVAATLKKESK